MRQIFIESLKSDSKIRSYAAPRYGHPEKWFFGWRHGSDVIVRFLKLSVIVRVLIGVGRKLLIIAAVWGVASYGATPQLARTGNADDLFAVFVSIRTSTLYSREAGEYEDPRFFSRLWLERSIKSALAASKEGEKGGLDWVEDSLLAHLAITLGVKTVYSHELGNSTLGDAALVLHVSDECGRPSTYTVDFTREGDTWKVSGTKSDTTEKGVSWFHADMPPVKEFPLVKLRDRSRYFNGSTLGKGIGLNVAGSECASSAPK